MLRTSTVQSTERVKIFPQKIFALKVGLGQEELQGIQEKINFLKKLYFFGTVQNLFSVNSLGTWFYSEEIS